jgi:hypothetical protein
MEGRDEGPGHMKMLTNLNMFFIPPFFKKKKAIVNSLWPSE